MVGQDEPAQALAGQLTKVGVKLDIDVMTDFAAG